MQGKNNLNPIKSSRRRASTYTYISPNQLSLAGFETPFDQNLTTENRWVKLSKILPWDRIINLYDKQFVSKEGRPPINGRIVIGAVIIKHMLNLSDRETIFQIQENMFMQYFLGYSSFTNEPPFDASLFVDIRERLNLQITTAISEIIVAHNFENTIKPSPVEPRDKNKSDDLPKAQNQGITQANNSGQIEDKLHKGTLLVDATVAPQNITFPTDLKVLNSAREKSEELIDKLYNKAIHLSEKPRTYRKIARKEYLQTAKKKNKSAKELNQSNLNQLRYLKRNLGYIEELLEVYGNDIRKSPLKEKLSDYYPTIKKVYEQQKYMLDNGLHSVEDRIVNIHQPHVRPIVRGKEGKKVEFGSKIHIALINGFSYIDRLDWDNFNEGTCLKASIENYFKRYKFYPQRVLADKIYCTRENRAYLKGLGIKLEAKPLGRPRKEAVSNHVSPGERNPVEGKFGQAKVAYGMNNILAKLKTTSESWIGSIVMVLNLVKLAGLIPLWIELIILKVEQEFKKSFNYFFLSVEFNSRP